MATMRKVQPATFASANNATRSRRRVPKEIADLPCPYCPRAPVEGCKMADFPRYGRRCEWLASRKIRLDAEREEAEGLALGLFRDADDIWCIEDPMTGELVSGKSTILGIAIKALLANIVVGIRIRAAQSAVERSEAEKARQAKKLAKRTKRTKPCADPTVSPGRAPRRKRPTDTH